MQIFKRNSFLSIECLEIHKILKWYHRDPLKISFAVQPNGVTSSLDRAADPISLQGAQSAQFHLQTRMLLLHFYLQTGKPARIFREELLYANSRTKTSHHYRKSDSP